MSLDLMVRLEVGRVRKGSSLGGRDLAGGWKSRGSASQASSFNCVLSLDYKERLTLVRLEGSLLGQVSTEILMDEVDVEPKVLESLYALRGDGDIHTGVRGTTLEGDDIEVGDGLADGILVVGLDVEGLVPIIGDLGGGSGQCQAEGCEELHFDGCSFVDRKNEAKEEGRMDG